MGLLFRTPDTVAIVEILNNAFSRKGLERIIEKGWESYLDAKTLKEIAEKLKLYPPTRAAKARWLDKFLKQLPSPIEQAIREAIRNCVVLRKGAPHGSTEPSDYKIQPIRCDTAEAPVTRLTIWEAPYSAPARIAENHLYILLETAELPVGVPTPTNRKGTATGSSTKSRN